MLSVTFVGTGGPEVTVDREGIATLVSTANGNYLFDAGRTVMQNLYEAGVDPRDVDTIILTHLHNDHIEGLPNLWMTGWFLLGREQPLKIVGPVGTKAMIEGMYAMYQFDVKHRANAFNDPAHLLIDVTELDAEGVFIDNGPLKFTAFLVEHGDGDPAFGYLIEDGSQSVLLSGDTRLCDNLIKHGQGVDILVSNILAMPDELAKKPEMQGVVAKLMTIPEAVELFNATQPRLAVYSHFVTKDIPHHSLDTFIESTTRSLGYTGALFLGKDGWSVGLPELEISPPPPAEQLPNLDRKVSYED
jgi:ribonuclease Z